MDRQQLKQDVGEACERRYIALILAGSDDYQEVNIEALKYVVKERGLEGVYVTVNKPFGAMEKLLSENGIDTGKIFFIDAISNEVGADKEDRSNALFLDSPHNLTDLSIATNEVLASMDEGDRVLFIDSLSALSIYNQPDTISDFAHYLTSKMRNSEVTGIIVSVTSELDEEVVSHLKQFCDVVIET